MYVLLYFSKFWLLPIQKASRGEHVEVHRMVGDGCQRRLALSTERVTPIFWAAKNSPPDEEGFAYFKNKIDNLLLYLSHNLLWRKYILGIVAQRWPLSLWSHCAPGRLFGLHLLWAHGAGWGWDDWSTVHSQASVLFAWKRSEVCKCVPDCVFFLSSTSSWLVSRKRLCWTGSPP